MKPGEEPLEELSVSTEHLEAAAQEFGQVSREMRKLVERLDRTARGLEEHWAGAPQEVFYKEYVEWREMMAGMAALLTRVGDELQAIAERFRDADT